jgi:LacI family transcriptional regulator
VRPTVHDIAATAGVSLATVDRVLNNRPGVKRATRERVENAIGTLGYVRDVAAANLAKSRIYSLAFILPDGDNSFMAALEAAIVEAKSRGPHERTRVSLVKVPAFDAEALANALDAIGDEGVDGVAAVAVDAPEVAAAVERLSEKGIPFVTLVSDLTASARAHYCGIDNSAAGRCAARLIGRFVSTPEAPVAVIAGSMLVKDHRERVEGFRDAMMRDHPELRVLAPIEGRDDGSIVYRQIGMLLDERPDVAAIYSLGAGNRGLVRALKERGLAGKVKVVAHELTPASRAALEDGTIDVIIAQDPGHEVRSAVRILKANADGQPVIDAQEKIGIDIFLKDNLP